MKIQTVTYSSLVSGPGYSNRTIAATGTVDEGEAPENALAALESWVVYQHNLRRKTEDEIAALDHDFWEKRAELRSIEDKIAAATKRFEAVKVISKALGVDLAAKLGPEFSLDDVPF